MPTQIVIYIIGIIGVIVVTGSIMGTFMFIERRWTKRKLNEALRKDDDRKDEA